MQISTTKFTKPPHNKFLLQCLDDIIYSKYANLYAHCKKWGVRGVYAFVTSTGLYGVAKEVAQGTIVQYGKRRLSFVVIGAASYISAPALAVITNATRVVKTCKVIYVGVGYIAEAVEDASQLSFLPLDMVLFGQPIPANQGGRFSSWSNITDLIDNLPVKE